MIFFLKPVIALFCAEAMLMPIHVNMECEVNSWRWPCWFSFGCCHHHDRQTNPEIRIVSIC
jgi:hypothetical protein